SVARCSPKYSGPTRRPVLGAGMTGDAYERLLAFLSADGDLNSPSFMNGDIDEAVSEAASFMADLRLASGDMAGSVIWHEVIDRISPDSNEEADGLRAGEQEVGQVRSSATVPGSASSICSSRRNPG